MTDPASTTASEPETLYEAIGGAPTVRRIVNRFYDLMDFDASYSELREIHASDLTPMRESLAGFLDGWLGGPRDWFEAHPGKCMMSMHAAVPVSPSSAGQWVEAMSRALDEAEVEPTLKALIKQAFGNMARNMAARG
ncbi:MAG: globin [Alphaproteobacteria bacterium PA2]|nr:MAG: globin [Alphaproteobacteria bacterium PA2]